MKGSKPSLFLRYVSTQEINIDTMKKQGTSADLL